MDAAQLRRYIASIQSNVISFDIFEASFFKELTAVNYSVGQNNYNGFFNHLNTNASCCAVSFIGVFELF